MVDFSQRSTQSEWMDDPAVSFLDYRSCLVELARVNEWMLAYRPVLRFFECLFPPGQSWNRPIEIVDVGSGYGDMLRQIAAWARRRKIDVSLTGVDINPWSRAAALEATDPALGIRWVTDDALAYMPPRGIDIVISSHFTHHLTNERVIEFIQWMEENARLGWFINDLHRHPVPHRLFGWFADLAALHPFVRHDGPVSIARAFVTEDWERMLAGAGIEPGTAKIEWMFPFRLTVARRKEMSTWSTQL
jgi:SAM-dependent methyltransferase